eukprot:4650751-Pleurochrysis_carterae.AAC.1
MGNGARRGPATSRTTRSTQAGPATEILAGQARFPIKSTRTSNRWNASYKNARENNAKRLGITCLP